MSETKGGKQQKSREKYNRRRKSKQKRPTSGRKATRTPPKSETRDNTHLGLLVRSRSSLSFFAFAASLTVLPLAPPPPFAEPPTWAPIDRPATILAAATGAHRKHSKRDGDVSQGEANVARREPAKEGTWPCLSTRTPIGIGRNETRTKGQRRHREQEPGANKRGAWWDRERKPNHRAPPRPPVGRFPHFNHVFILANLLSTSMMVTRYRHSSVGTTPPQWN